MSGLRVCLVFCVAAITFGDDQPDRFEYHAKQLDKMVRLEQKMERMEKDLREAKAEVDTIIDDETDILENKTAEFEQLERRADQPQVSFNVNQIVDTSPETNQIMIWQNVLLNEGNAYDNVIGIFTAPVSGLYYFAVHMCNYSAQVVTYAIVLDGTVIAQTYKYDKYVNDCGSISTFTMVAAGQRVWVKCLSGSASTTQIWSSSMSSFIGALIHK